MAEGGFSFPSLAPPQPLKPKNPLLEKATVVDTTASAGTSISTAATANPIQSPLPATQITNAPAMPPPSLPSTSATTPAASLVPKIRKKVPYEKGYSQWDWIRLTTSGTDLTGLGKGTRPRKDIPLSEVAQHNTLQDGWTILRGKVYNTTPYLKFHPGGEKILKQILGKDGTSQFNKYHAWVNVEALLAKCMIGTIESKPAVSLHS